MKGILLYYEKFLYIYKSCFITALYYLQFYSQILNKKIKNDNLLQMVVNYRNKNQKFVIKLKAVNAYSI